MLNVSQTQEKTYQILTRPLMPTSTSRPAQQQQHNESQNNVPKTTSSTTSYPSIPSTTTQTITNTNNSSTPALTQSSVMSHPMSSSSMTCSTSQPSSQLSNGSQSLRSTVLANNTTNSNNSKDKSPMCLINELSRCNDIKHEYHLIEEFGPPHDKTFIVVLKLGDTEEYRSDGPSIKKAQRSAATLALQQTKFRHPSPKVSKINESKGMWPLTPTVELNVLAMKLGENAVYHVYEPPRPQPQSYPFGAIGATGATNAYDFRGMHYQRYHIPRGPYCATLNVGSRQFVGKGRTAQAARHAAAEEALKVLRELPLPQNNNENNAENNETNDGIDANTNSSDDYIKSPISLIHEMALKRNLSVKFEVVGETGPSHLPKFVTQCTVGEIVTTGEGNGKKVSKKNAAIKMLDELKKLEPLPTVHKCDDNKEISDQSVGSSVANTQRHKNPRHRKPFVKKKRSNSNIIKDTALKPSEDNNKETNDSSVNNNNNNNLINTNTNNNLNSNLSNGNISNKSEELVLESSSNGTTSSSSTIHPINRLIQLQQARKEKEPIFNVISERCTDRRRREFSIECTINITKGSNAPQVISAIGLGPNKKVAKKNAAESMLQQLGYSSKPQPQSILKQDSGEGQQLQKKIRQVKFVEDKSDQQLLDLSLIQPKMGRQLVPGLILMPTETNVGLKNGTNSRIDTNSMGDSTDLLSKKSTNTSLTENISTKIKLISVIATEYLESTVGISTTALALEAEKKNLVEDQNGSKLDINSKSELEAKPKRRPMEQLAVLAEIIGSNTIQVHFSDFPKKHINNQIEYLSVVTITTIWGSMPIVSHGTGSSQEESRDQASHQALIALSKLDETQYN